MDKILIKGGECLRGRVVVSGSKNAALPILISSILSEEKSKFRNVPHLKDIQSTADLLADMGRSIERGEHEFVVSEGGLKKLEAHYDLVRKMRASVLVLGPMLAHYGEAKVSLPGGCAIGARPVNYHIEGLKHLGAKIAIDNGYIIATSSGLKGNRVPFEFPSVGATENILMAATLAKGETRIENAAKEPEIVDLANALRSMGAEIEGDGTETILVQGQNSLKACDYKIMGDRIEAGTYLCAALATKGTITVSGIDPISIEALLAKFEEAGARVTRSLNEVAVCGQNGLKGVDIDTAPFPGFPTDMQAQFMALMTQAQGASMITEHVFENRFMHVSELLRLGADITIKGKSALVRGSKNLTSAEMMATDLRASASLIIGALVAEGESTIHRIYHLDRGYEGLESKLSVLGAIIRREKE